jgi:ribosomal protein S8
MKNAAMRGVDECLVVHTKYSLALVKKMKEAGILIDFSMVEEKNSKKMIEVVMKRLSKKEKPLMLHVHIVSKPSFPIYMKHNAISKLVKGHLFNKIFFFSTPKGILTAQEATRDSVGGKSLFYVEVLQNNTV